MRHSKPQWGHFTDFAPAGGLILSRQFIHLTCPVVLPLAVISAVVCSVKIILLLPAFSNKIISNPSRECQTALMKLFINLTPLIPLSLPRRGGRDLREGLSPLSQTYTPFPPTSSGGRGSGGWVSKRPLYWATEDLGGYNPLSAT